MAFDTTTRNRLAKFVAEARRVLTEEFSEQLQSLYGISASGGIAPLERLSHLDAEGLELAATLRQRIAYLTSSSPAAGDATKPAIDRLTREQAFTVLNRLAAIRMAEKRGLIVESVGQQYQSKGFKVFESVAGSAIGDTYDRYRCYLFCLFDELAIDLGSLFDRRSPQALLFPREQPLLALLTLLDDADLQELWAEDETIGWIYQYYNDPAERKKMREESSAPRNSRELAVRNQFFTPRYVVEFLTDNTLGRIWYEMTQGATALKEQCRYLVRRPDEVFLAQADSGEVEEAQAWLQDAKGKRPDLWRLAHTVNGYARAGAPGEDSNRWVEDRLPRVTPDTIATLTTQELLDLLFLFCRKERFCEGTLDSLQAEIDLTLETVETRGANGRRTDASQEDLLKQPVFIAHRPLKDPRSILMLDPACGSMHFGLYAFDLFEAIYDEAWEIAAGSDDAAKSGEAFSPFCTFAASFADKAAFQREVPRMIVEHNLHGIDIDPRAAQIAGLSLWLRAQRAWHAASVKPVDRPRITRSNIVCAEPMPGDKVLLAEFVEQQFPEGERAAFGFLLETVFDRMTLAGEAGSLLKIEEEIRTAIADAKKLWQKEPQQTQRMLFAGGEDAPATTQKKLDLSGITDEQFWAGAEERIYDALRDYAEQAETGGFQRRLFAEDAARGFAFIDVCRKRYDVALMNPPFGEPSSQTTELLESQYYETKADIDAAFVDRASDIMLADGLLGGIYNRTQFFKGYLPEWRDRNLLVRRQIATCLDLGLGVLDGAMVEAAAYTTSLPIQNRPAVFITALAHVDKENAVNTAYAEMIKGGVGRECRIVNTSSLLQLPGHRISYWVASRLLDAFDEHECLEGTLGYARQGLITSDNDRFLRLIWEVPSECFGRSADDYRQEHLRSNSHAQHWIPYAKGGDYAPFFGDIHLAVNWGGDGREICTFFRDGRLASRPQNTSFYFQRALTYTERTASDFSPRVMPDGCIFDCKGPIIAAAKDNAHLLGLLALTNSKPFKYFVELSLAGGDSSVSVGAARQFTQSIVGSVPIPKAFVDRNVELASIGKDVWVALAQNDAMEETSRFFSTEVRAETRAARHLRDAYELHANTRDSRFLRIIELTEQLEDVVSELYCLDKDSRQEVANVCGEHPNRLEEHVFLTLSPEDQRRVFATPVDQVIGGLRERGSVARSITKMCYSADRWLEVIAAAYSTRPDLIIQQKRKLAVVEPSLFIDSTAGCVSYTVGVAFGRWDIRYATGEKAAPELPDPFAPLPVCPPGQLQNADGLPAGPENVPATYPIKDIPWDGILVDDANHPLDIERRVREVMEVIWTGKEGSPTAEAIELEACEILGVKTLRDYFRKPANFFADHLKRYSKSRRQAPIYWPLSTKSGSYTLWIYYHRLNDQTLHKCLADFLDPKIQDVERELGKLTGKDSDRAADLRDFLNELKDLKDEIERVIKLPWKPNLNDGVLITASPLSKLFRLSKWQKDLKACWEELEKGDYDWAHLAYTIWPERVEKVCEKDRSIAIAHGLEHLCKIEPPKPKKPRGKKASS